jgi:hypothetical protein
MKKFILVILVITVSTNWALSQGCVAIRNIGGISPDLLFENIGPNDKLIFNITNRYFEASKAIKVIRFILTPWSQIAFILLIYPC